jgi:hypothetical protein
MNRRSFLRGLIAAPAVVPMAAATQSSGSRLKPMCFGNVRNYTPPPFFTTGDAISESNRLMALNRWAGYRRDGSWMEGEFLPADSIEPHLRDTPEQHALVSPDDQEKRKPESLPA